MTVTDVASLLPLHPLDFRILLALHGGQSHAYAIVAAIEAESADGPRIYPANLYRRLRDLTASGLLEEQAVPPGAGQRRKRDFRLTALGRQVLRAEVARMEGLLAAARQLGVSAP